MSEWNKMKLICTRHSSIPFEIKSLQQEKASWPKKLKLDLWEKFGKRWFGNIALYALLLMIIKNDM